MGSAPYIGPRLQVGQYSAVGPLSRQYSTYYSLLSYFVRYPLIASRVHHSHDWVTSLTLDDLHMLHNAVEVDFEALC